MIDRCRGIVLILMTVVLLSMSACSAIEERLEMGTLMSDQVSKGMDNLTPGSPDLPEDEGVGGGGEDEDDDSLQGSGAIGTAIQQTVDARNTVTAAAQVTDQQTPTNTVDVTLTVPAEQLTALAQTLTAIVMSSTPTIDQTPSMTPTATMTYTPSPTPTNFTPTPTEAPCNAFRFVSHVTFPPGSIVQPDTGFYKSWYVQNIGSCTWTPSYSLIYHSGFQLGGRSPLYLNGYIQPGEFVVLSIQLYSNPQPGTYQGNWWLQDGQGNAFGGGDNRDEPLLVEIIVPGQQQPVFTSPAVTPPPFYTSTPSP